MHIPEYSRHTQAGTTLLEVLITVILVSLGLLGLAGLQLTTVQNTNSATERFEATTLARDILERMRANRQRALPEPAGTPSPYDLAMGAVPAAGGLEGVDLVAWRQALAVLPGGDGSVAVDTVQGVATIVVAWTDASDDNADDSREMSLVLRTRL